VYDDSIDDSTSDVKKNKLFFYIYKDICNI